MGWLARLLGPRRRRKASDSIPVWISPGEEIVHLRRADELGMLNAATVRQLTGLGDSL